MLTVRDLRASYDRAEALHGVDFDVSEGSIVCVIGANGAGKSTLVNSIMGWVSEVSGSIHFQGKELRRSRTHARVRQGLSLVPEGRRVFAPRSVEETLELGAFTLVGPSRRAAIADRMQGVFELFPRLAERRDQAAGTLSGGEQQMLAIGRALMSDPKMLLLDEPSLGLAPIVVEQIFEALGRLNREQRMSMLLIEQNAMEALKLADHAYVLETGRVTAAGPAVDLSADPVIRHAYLRVGARADASERSAQ